MITSKVSLAAIRGDTWLVHIPIQVLQPDGKTRREATQDEWDNLKRSFPRLIFEGEEPRPVLVLDSLQGELGWNDGTKSLAITASSAKMSLPDTVTNFPFRIRLSSAEWLPAVPRTPELCGDFSSGCLPCRTPECGRQLLPHNSPQAS